MKSNEELYLKYLKEVDPNSALLYEKEISEKDPFINIEKKIACGLALYPGLVADKIDEIAKSCGLKGDISVDFDIISFNYNGRRSQFNNFNEEYKNEFNVI